MRLRNRYFRTPNGVLLNARQAQEYPHQDLRPVVTRRDPRWREQFAVSESRRGKLTRAERNALKLMLKRVMSTHEAAAKLSCSPEALIRLVLGFTNHALSKRVRTKLKKDYLAAIEPRRTDNEREHLRENEQDGWPELNQLILDCRREIHANGNGNSRAGTVGRKRIR